jgi:hypothetical protein
MFVASALVLSAFPVRGADEAKGAAKGADKPKAELTAEQQKKRDDVNREKKEAAGKQKGAAGATKVPGPEKSAGLAKGAGAKMFELPKPIQDALSDEQKAQVAELQKEYGPKLEQAASTLGKILTPDLRKEQAEAAAAAAQKVLDEKLSDAQKADLKTAQAELETVQRELKEKLLALVPEAQRSALKGSAPVTKEKKPAGDAKTKGEKPAGEVKQKSAPAAEKPAAEKKKSE